MNTVQLRDAKARLSALVEAAEKGESTTITKLLDTSGLRNG